MCVALLCAIYLRVEIVSGVWTQVVHVTVSTVDYIDLVVGRFRVGVRGSVVHCPLNNPWWEHHHIKL